jgi:hypothetical protein
MIRSISANVPHFERLAGMGDGIDGFDFERNFCCFVIA